MLLEKVNFLEEAIRNAREEALEELTALEEGAELYTSITTLKKIWNDLLHSVEHFEECLIQDEVDVTVGTLSSHRFKIGDFVTSKSTLPMPSKSLKIDFGYDESTPFLLPPLFEFGFKATVTKIGYSSARDCLAYVIEQNGKHFFALEDDISFYEEEMISPGSISPVTKKFIVGDEVKVNGLLFYPLEELYEAAGLPTSVPVLGGYEKEIPSAIVIGSFPSPYGEETFYVVEADGDKFFVSPKILTKAKEGFSVLPMVKDDVEYLFKPGDVILSSDPPIYIPENDLFDSFGIPVTEEKEYFPHCSQFKADAPCTVIAMRENVYWRGLPCYLVKQEEHYFFAKEERFKKAE